MSKKGFLTSTARRALGFATVVAFGTCSAMPTAAFAAPATYTGPFAHPSTLLFHAPDFSHLKDSDYQPAIEAGIAQKRAEVERIANNPAAPTFANTVVALETSGQLLARVTGVFDQLVAADTNPTLDAVDSAMSPKRAALSDAIHLNARLFARIKAVHDSAAGKALKGEDAMLLQTTYDEFVHAGALLSTEKKAELKTLNQQIASLETEFSQKLTQGSAAAAPVFDTKAELAGLSDAEIAAAAQMADKNGHPGKYMLALLNTTQQPDLAKLSDRESRRKLLEASEMRTSHGGPYDTNAVIHKIAVLRAQKAALLGKPDYATVQMYDGMVTSPDKAMAFMKGFVPALRATQDKEAAQLAAEARADGQTQPLAAWDWAYYAEKLRKKTYDLDDSQIKPYFNVWNVLKNGVFYAAHQMYGITFKQRTDLVGYEKSMRVYEVFDKDGSPLALLYYDPFARPNKQGGAWMGNFVNESTVLGNKPVVYNTLNITPPAPGAEPLATWDDVVTMFHEFGHALNGMFGHQKYPSLSGANTARDFVEFPSQFNENFAADPQILAHYAKNLKTGETIPKPLLDKILASRKFNQGLAFGELTEAAMLDMDWHMLTPAQAESETADPAAFEAKAMADTGLRTDLVPPRYRSTYFRHIWSGGYAAGYFAYMWTEMLAHDGWQWVQTHGGINRANGEHIRNSFLGEGHSKSYSVMFKDFTGHGPQIEPMVKARGLDETATGK